jgi:hypothetical protein
MDEVLGAPSWFSLGFLRPGPELGFGSSQRAFGTPGDATRSRRRPRMRRMVSLPGTKPKNRSQRERSWPVPSSGCST